MSMGRMLWGPVAGVSLWCVCGVAMADLVIDRFDGGRVELILDETTPSFAWAEVSGLAGVVGGVRRTSVTRTAAANVEMRIDALTPGMASYASGASGDGYCELEYGGGGGLDLDLSAGGGSALTLRIWFADLAGTASIWLGTDGVGWSRAGAVVPRVRDAGNPIGWIEFPFDGFGVESGAGARIDDVDFVRVRLDPPAMGDWLLDEILVRDLIPETSSIVMALGLLMAVAVVRRRARHRVPGG